LEARNDDSYQLVRTLSRNSALVIKLVKLIELGYRKVALTNVTYYYALTASLLPNDSSAN
jgi:hypothetical protein